MSSNGAISSFKPLGAHLGPLGAQKPLKLSAAETDLGDYKTERLKCSTSRCAMLENGAVSSFKSIGAEKTRNGIFSRDGTQRLLDLRS